MLYIILCANNCISKYIHLHIYAYVCVYIYIYIYIYIFGDEIWRVPSDSHRYAAARGREHAQASCGRRHHRHYVVYDVQGVYYIHVCLCMYICIIHTYTYIHVYICMCTYMHTYRCVCMCVCVCVFVYYMYVYVCVYMYTYTHTHTHTHTHMHICIYNLQGSADAAMMGQVCFDAYALGNHEFDDGDASLSHFLTQLASTGCSTQVHVYVRTYIHIYT